MKFKTLWNTVRMEGFVDTMSIFLMQRIMANHENRNTIFDRKYKVDTIGWIQANDQAFIGNNRESAVYYYPSSIASIKAIFSELKSMRIDFSEYIFIDLGSGKGKPLFLASDYPFRYIVGVEASTDTCKIAEDNIVSYRSSRQKCKDIRVINEDILNFDFPDENILIFLGNPLVPNSPLYNTLLDNLANTVKAYGKKIYLLYYCPDSYKMFDNKEYLKKVKHYNSLFDSHDWVIYKVEPN